MLLVLTLLIGALVGLAVVAFIVSTEPLAAWLLPPGGPSWRRIAVPTAGALLSGFLLARYFPNARGSGIPQTKTALFLRRGYIRLSTAVGKFACSAISLGSGIALGREGPTVQVGAGIASSLGRRLGLGPRRVQALVPIGTSAALAAAFNKPISAVLFTLEEILGDLHAPVLGSSAYALVGMGTAFAGIIRAPMTSVIMIFEITRDYSIIVPVMIANLLAYFISERLQPEPVYEALLHQDRIVLPPPRAGGTALTVERAFRTSPLTFDVRTPVGECLASVASLASGSGGPRDAWPVFEGERFRRWRGSAATRRRGST